MYIVCSFTLKYFPSYDEYGHVHYDDDHHHVLHDIRGFVVLPDVRLQPTSSIMQTQEVFKPTWWAHARTCGLCVGKYYTSNFFRTGDHLYNDFK